MKTEHNPFAAQPLAGLLADMRLESARLAAQRGVLVVLHALILSALTRLLGRLDAMFTLWQSGQLPTPIRTSRAPTVILNEVKDPRFLRPAAAPCRSGIPHHPERKKPPPDPTGRSASNSFR